MQLAVLASGGGTILGSILDAGLDVGVVISDRPCSALERAEAAGVAAVLVQRDSFGPTFDRPAYTVRVVEALQAREVDVVAMAGFMTILSPVMLHTFPDRVLNTHPSLLPSFPGAHAVADALAFGVKVTGCTVHLATEQVDHGPILAQEAVAVLPDDDVETLHERIKEAERRLYPAALKEFLG